MQEPNPQTCLPTLHHDITFSKKTLQLQEDTNLPVQPLHQVAMGHSAFVLREEQPKKIRLAPL